MKNSTTIIAFITAVALHLIVGGILLMNIEFSLPKEKPKEKIINAAVVDQKLFDDLAQRKKENLLAEKKKQEDIRKEKERVKKEEALRKQQEVQRIKEEKAQAERKKQEAERIQAEKIAQEKAAKERAVKEAQEKIAKEKAVKEAQEKAAKEKAVKEAQEKAAKEKAIKEAQEKAAKEKAIKEAQEKAAKEKAQKEAAEKERLRKAELERLMEDEFAEEFSSAQSAKQLSEIARYKALIQDKISRNWQIDANMKGKTCTLAIRLAPDGLVLSADKSKGDDKLCASAKRAALKARTLPIPKDPKIASQFRDFDITLDPDL